MQTARSPNPNNDPYNKAPPHRPSTPFPPNLSRFAGQTATLNPGNLTDLHRKCRSIAPEWLEGIQFGVRRQCSPNWGVHFTSLLSHTSPCGVRIGGAYSRRVHDDPNELRTPFVQADINPSTMCVCLDVMLQPCSWFRAELMAQLVPHGKTAVPANGLRMDVMGGSFTATLYAWNLRADAGRLALAYLQSVTERLSVGAEFCAEWSGGGGGSPKQTVGSTALAVRYAKDKQCLSATASMQAFDVSYWRQVHDSIQLGTSVVYNERNKSAIGNIVYQWQFDQTVVRGMLDSEWSTGFTYTRHIRDLCCNMGISVLFCVPTNKFACGLKFDFDANGKLW